MLKPWFVGAIALLSVCSVSRGTPARAQLPLESDTSLGGESSIVTLVPGVPDAFIIEGGATRGGNLFHSFREFNVNENGGVFFNDPAAIDTLITRVTGDNPSTILGVLGTFNDADLFLLNPNGIIFGENARLLMQGSFLATTADRVLFPNDLDFSAVNPDPSSLLSINVPIGLQFGNQPAPITSEALLAVPTTSSLVFAGGPVTLDDGTLLIFAPNDVGIASGRIEVAAIGGAGTVDLFTTDGTLALGLPDTLPRADVSLRDTFLGMLSGEGGGISLFGDNIRLQDNSRLSMVLDENLGTPQSQLGSIRLDASGLVLVSEDSLIQNVVFENAIGNGGDVQIQADELAVRGGSQIITSTNGRGDAGDIVVRVRDRALLTGINTDASFESGIISNLLPSGVGNGGQIDITAPVLEILDGASIGANVGGQGNGGEIVIRARDRLTVSGISPGGEFTSGINTIILPTGRGDSGSITIRTGALQVSDGADISSIVGGIGDAGDITIRARDRVRVEGTNGTNFSSIGSDTLANTEGNGGNLDIRTPILEVLDGAGLSTDINGTGESGNIRVIASRRIRFADNRPDGALPSFLFSGVGNMGNGTGGTLDLRAPVVEVLGGSLINAGTLGNGDSGAIRIRARDRLLVAGSNAGGTGSLISSNVGMNAVGNGGGIDIMTGRLEVRDGGLIFADTFGRGNAGDVFIRAQESVTFSGRTPNGRLGSGVTSDVTQDAVGNGGNVEIRTAVLEVRNGAQMGSSTFGRGNAGSLIIRARDRARFIGNPVDDGIETGAFSSVEGNAQGNGGQILINTSVLEMQGRAQIGTTTFGNGNAGNIRINASDRAQFFRAPASGQPFINVSSLIERDGVGVGGNIRINTPVLDIAGRSVLSASVAGTGEAGQVLIRSDRVRIRDGSSLQSGVTEGGRGVGGRIDLRARTLQLQSGGRLITSTQGQGDAGDIFVQVGDRFEISGRQPDDASIDSGIFSQVGQPAIGEGGRIEIATGALAIDSGSVSARSQGNGRAGGIFVTADVLQLTNQARLLTETLTTDGGNITLDINDLLLLRNNSLISTEAGTSQSGGDGGDIILNNANGFIVAVPQENSDIVANAFEGRGGNIRITTQGIFGLEFRDERTPFSDITASSEIGVDGDVEIITPNVDPTQGLVALPTEVVDAADQIGQVCPTRIGTPAALGRFVITGRGGIAPSPLDVLDQPDITVDWLEDDRPTPATATPHSQRQHPTPSLVEADSWTRGENGRVHLVAAQQTTLSDRGEVLPCF